MELRADFGAVAEDYEKYRVGFPESLLSRLERYGIGLIGQRVLDLGTGTGSLARLFAVRGCQVVGIDPAVQLLERAQALDRGFGVEIEYHEATAEDTGLNAGMFDVVTAGQSWHWFDRAAAAREVMRLLVPTGQIVIAHFDWLPFGDSVVQRTEALILRYNPRWQLAGGTGLHPEWLSDLHDAGFVGIETFSYDVAVTYSHEAWVGRIRASAGISTLAASVRHRFSDDLHQLLQERFADPLEIPHRVWAVVASKEVVSGH